MPSDIKNLVAEVPLLNDRFIKFSKVIQENETLNKEVVPGLADLLQDEASDHVTVSSEQFARRLLKVFKESKEPTFTNTVAECTSDEQARLNKFTAGASVDSIAKGFQIGPTRGTRQEFRHLHEAPKATLSQLSAVDAKHVRTGTGAVEDAAAGEQVSLHAVDIGLHDDTTPITVSSPQSCGWFLS